MRLLPWIGGAVATVVSMASAGQLIGGLDRASFDAAVRPQDDLYAHVNAGWLARTAIPQDRVSHDSFTELSDKVERDVLAIITEISGRAGRREGSPAQQIADLYRSVTDEATIESQGAAPLGPSVGGGFREGPLCRHLRSSHLRDRLSSGRYRRGKAER